jgi:hypothetical protein
MGSYVVFQRSNVVKHRINDESNSDNFDYFIKHIYTTGDIKSLKHLFLEALQQKSSPIRRALCYERIG